jgi:uncharacterized protein (DUF1501 family)
MTVEKLQERDALLHSLDTLSRDLDDARGSGAGMDAFRDQALGLLTTSKVRDALDLSREPDKVRSKYGQWTDYLLARRLVEAGVSVVTLFPSHGGSASVGSSWDHHGDIFTKLRQFLPELDQALYALITDIHDRGLEQHVAVLVCGEMGRTPWLQKDYASPGRNHWTTGFALLAGGGLRVGQVVGATDGRAAQPKGRAYTPGNILATLYRVLGYNPEQTTISDPSGRPLPLLEETEAIAELL